MTDEKRLEYRREWYRKNKDKADAYKKKYLSAHPEKAEELKERRRENAKKWRDENPDRARDQARRCYLRNREQRQLYFRARYQTMRNKAKAFDELMSMSAEELAEMLSKVKEDGQEEQD